MPIAPRLIAAAAAALAVLLAATLEPAHAQAGRPVRLIVGFPPGGAADNVARVLATELATPLGQQVIVDNRPGASGNIATQAVVAAPADGQTLLFAQIILATNPWLMSVGYDPAKDIAFVSQLTSVPVVLLTRPDSKFKSLKDVVQAGKAEGGKLIIGSGGIGTSTHFAAELLSRGAGFKYTHVPFKGGAQALTALLGGEIELMFDLVSGSIQSNIGAGKVRALGVMQQARATALPDTPSAGEQGLGPDVFIRTWMGIAVRGGTDPKLVEKLHAAVAAAARSPEFSKRVAQLGMETSVSATPAEAQQFYLADLKRWGELIRAAGIKAE